MIMLPSRFWPRPKTTASNDEPMPSGKASPTLSSTPIDYRISSQENLEFHVQQVAHLYSLAHIGLIATVVNLTILTFILWPIASHQDLFLWASSLTVITFARAILTYKYRTTTIPPRHALYWGHCFIVGIALSGIGWGSVGIFLFPMDSIVHQIFLAFVLGGMVAGVAGTYSVLKGAFYAFSVPALTPFIAQCFALGDEIHMGMGSMVLVFGLLMVGTSKRVHDMVSTSLLLRFENSSLVGTLSRSKHQTEKLNEDLKVEIRQRQKVEEELRAHRDRLETLITERTEKLRASEAQYRLVTDHVIDIIWVMALDGTHFSFMSPSVEKVRGYTPEEAMSLSLQDTVTPASLGTFLKVLEEELAYETTGTADPLRSRTFELELQCKNGSTVWSEVKASFLRDQNGQAIGVLGVARDITDRKQSEEAMQLTQTVFDILPDHISVVGPDYRYRRVNPVYEQVYGLPITEVIGSHMADLFGPQVFQEVVKPQFDRCLTGEQVFYESWFTLKEGQPRFIAVTYSPLRSKSDPSQVEAVVVNSRDLTVRKTMEEALIQSEQHLRSLLEERTRISQDLHDHILQSLYAVGLTISAMKQPLENNQIQKAFPYLDRAVAQLNLAITEIRCFIERLPHTAYHTEDFILEVNALVRSMKLPTGPHIQVKVDPDAAQLLGNEEISHLLNIVRESLSNCYRHAHASRGQVILQRQLETLRLEVWDNGKGFEKTSSGTRGQGLRNMESRAQQLGGRLEVDSRPGQGTRIILELPQRPSSCEKS